MSVADRAATLGPYAQHLLDNEDVHANLERVVGASRDAYERARNKKLKAQAVQDRTIERRVLEAAQAARNVVLTLGRERKKQQRNRRGKLALALGIGIAGAGVGLALAPQVREKVLSRFQTDSSDATPPA